MEKPARAAYLSLVMRNLSKNTIVIADGGAGTNIKGFRYQLWCAAREIGIRCVSVFCVAKPEVCTERNQRRQASLLQEIQQPDQYEEQEAYEENTMDELLMRFEEPNDMTRWDSPLFVIDCNPRPPPVDDTVGALEVWDKAPIDAVWEAATSGRLTKAPDVVAPNRATTNNYLSLLESTSQLVLSTLQELVALGTLSDGSGGKVQLSITFPSGAPPVQLPLYLPVGKKAPTTAALQRLRRQFVKMHASGAMAGNELGRALSHEGRASAIGTVESANSRAQRKGQQTLVTGSPKQAIVAKSTEEEIARRFTAYLEETL